MSLPETISLPPTLMETLPVIPLDAVDRPMETLVTVFPDRFVVFMTSSENVFDAVPIFILLFAEPSKIPFSNPHNTPPSSFAHESLLVALISQETFSGEPASGMDILPFPAFSPLASEEK